MNVCVERNWQRIDDDTRLDHYAVIEGHRVGVYPTDSDGVCRHLH